MPRTSLSLYPEDRAKLGEIADHLVDRGFAFSLSVAFRAALELAAELAAEVPPKAGAIAEPLTMQFTDAERSKLTQLARAYLAPGGALNVPSTVRRVIQAATIGPKLDAAAERVKANDGRRKRASRAKTG